MANKGINVLLSLKDMFSGPLKKVENNTKQAEKAFRRSQNAITNLGKQGASALGNLAIYSGTVLAASIAALGGYSIKVGAEFEASMSKVQAISGATGDTMVALREKAKEMGATTKFSASEAGQAMQYMAMAGWKAQDMLSGISGIMDLAAASGEDLARVSDIVTDALTAFGLSASDSARFADVLASASSNSNTNVSMMGDTFKYVAPLAGSLKYSIEDVATAIGLMANAGIKGEQAGTALRATIQRMIDPPKEARVALEQLGVSIKNSDGTVKPFGQTLIELRKAFSSLSDSQKAEYASSIAGTNAMSGFLSLVNASDTDFNKLSQAINNSAGTAKNMAQVMQNNLSGQMTQFKSVTEGIGISIYDKFKAPLTEAFKSVNKALGDLNSSINNGQLSDSFTRLGESIGKMVNAITNGLIAALPVLVNMFSFLVNNGDIIISILSGIAAGFVAFKVGSLITSVTTALQGCSSAMMVLNAIMAANPIGMVALAIGALVGAIVLLWQNWDKVTEAINSAWNMLKEVGNYLKDKFLSILSPIIDGVGKIASGFSNLGNRLTGGGNQEQHNALGSSFWKGGSTFVNEGNRGELINLPSGAQIVPHDISMRAGKGTSINISFNVSGNLIGNEEFINECGEKITSRLMTALGNV